MAKKHAIMPKSVAERISDVAQRWFLVEPLLFAAYCTHATDGIAPDPVVPAEARFSRPVVWIITDDDLVPTIRQGWENINGS